MSKGVNRIRLNNRTDDKPNASCAVAISVAGLWKRYGPTAAVCDVSFEVGAGQIFGLLGANGAGKTTTLECILGLRQPDGGSIQINGLDLRTHAAQAKRLVGAQLQAATLQDRITPRQALDLFGSFYSQSFGSGELLARFDLEAKADVPFATLSGASYSSGGWWLGVGYSSPGIITLSVNAGSTNSTAQINDGNWHHVVATRISEIGRASCRERV